MSKAKINPIPQPIRIRGFTLLELLTVLAVLSILLTMAISWGRPLLLENRSVVNLNGLLRAINYARSEAILRGDNLILCASSDQQKCNTAQWEKGQILLTKEGVLLHLFSGLAAGGRLIWNSSFNKDSSIEWLATGFTNGQRGSFYYCAENAAIKNSKKLVLLNTGRTYIEELTEQEYTNNCKN